MTSLLDIGINSLYTSRQALTLSNHNIANANNPFYSRRTIDLSEVNNGIFGGGVKIGDIRRIVDEFTNQSLLKAQSNFTFADKQLEKLNELEMLLDNDSTGLNEVINQSLNDLNNLNANAASGTNRTVYLQKLKSIVARFQGLDQSINELHSNARRSIQLEVKNVNEIIQKLADINRQVGQSSSPDAPENMSLLDQRDKLLSELSEHISFTSQTNEKGVLNIQIGKGVPLLTGVDTSTLKAKSSSDDPMLLSLEADNGKTATTISTLANGGKIASLMAFQKEHLLSAQNALGRLALGLSDALNTQNKKGMDLKGELGQNIFTDINDAVMKQDRVILNTSNAGTGTLSVDVLDTKKLTTGDYVLKFDSASDYQLVRSIDKEVVASGSIGALPHSIDVDGVQLNITAASFQAGDSVLIAPTRNASGIMDVNLTDGSKLALAFPVSVNHSQSNTGRGEIQVTSINDVSNLAFSTPKQLSPPVRVEFTSPLTYRLVNANDDSVIEAGISYDPKNGQDIFPTPGGYNPGYQVHLQGDVQAGDEFTIDYNTSGVGDNRNGIFMADIYHEGLFNEGEFNLVQAYNAISGDVSSKTHAAKYELESQEVIRAQTQERRDQMSGVSIEEETMNMARFEQSYIASAQVLDVFKTLFQTVIGMMRN